MCVHVYLSVKCDVCIYVCDHVWEMHVCQFRVGNAFAQVTVCAGLHIIYRIVVW